jgi:hypothetical protein
MLYIEKWVRIALRLSQVALSGKVTRPSGMKDRDETMIEK